LRGYHPNTDISILVKRGHCNASLSRGNLPESGRDVGENLIAETLACPSSKKVTMNTGGTMIG
jgi:hypothetical protein